jgi:hypothetical protein
LGCAAIIDSSPRLYSMLLNDKGRWVGKIWKQKPKTL